MAERSPPGLLLLKVAVVLSLTRLPATLPLTSPLPGRLDPLPVNTPRVRIVFAGALPTRAGVKLLTFMVCTGMREAAAPGAVRAMTARACTDAEGVAR